MIDGGDDPIDGTDRAPDLLGRSQFAETVVTALSAVRRQGRSSVLGLVGPWGSGKSSVINLVRRRLDDSGNDWRVAICTPWLYSDLETLQAGFFEELREALPDDQRWSLTRQKIAKLAVAVSPTANIKGFDASSLVRAGAAQWGGLSADATKRSAEAALEKSGVPILMVLDDIDRLTPDELLLVFKLIRVVGRLPNVYYLIAYDEQTVLDLLANTDLIDCEHSPGRARDYLEKIVQIRLDIPPLRVQDASELLNRELVRFLEQHNLSGRIELLQRFTSVYYEFLVDRLNTPRAIRRYVSQLEALYGRLATEVDLADFMLLTWLRVAEPAAYRLVQQNRADLTGTVSSQHEVTRFVRDTDAKNTITRWENQLRGVGVAEGDVRLVIGVLGELFPRIGLALRGASHAVDDNTLQAVHERKGVTHSDFFDRYFAIGVPRDDVADTEIDAALVDLANGGLLRETVRTALLNDTARTLRKFNVARNRDDYPAIAVIELLVDLYPRLPAEPGAVISSREAIRAHLGRALPDLLAAGIDPVPNDDREQLVSDMQSTDSGLMLLTNAIADADLIQRPTGWLAEHQTAIFDAVANRLAKEGSPNAVGQLLWNSFAAWRTVAPKAAARWIRDQICAGRWDLFETAACLLEHSPASSRGDLDRTLAPIVEVLGSGSLDELVRLAGSGAVDRKTSSDDPELLKRHEALLAALQTILSRRKERPGQS
ncbi:P-loop NTPase fold protein [Kribbella sp. NPDC050124]|uniref:KAP family P-loop NTPase fold protein n=1 Tax=Kribbella sp. NPDC050124 TaxID=3364114 RepID=UPI0037B5D492